MAASKAAPKPAEHVETKPVEDDKPKAMSAARKKFLAGELTWRDLCEAEAG